MKRLTISVRKPRLWWPDSTNGGSGKPGAVHYLQQIFKGNRVRINRFLRGPLIDPLVTLPEIVSSFTATQSPRSALPGATGEVTASWYGSYHHDKLTASGQRFDMHKNTLAHRTLPLGTKVRLINRNNGKVAEGVVNDRGPYIKGRDVDVSYAIAEQLGFVTKGVIKLIIEPILVIGETDQGD